MKNFIKNKSFSSFIILISILTLFTVSSNAEISKALCVTLNNGENINIPFEGSLEFENDGDYNIVAFTSNEEYSIPIADIKTFNVIAYTADDSGSKEIVSDKNQNWTIYSIEGNFISGGVGIPDLNSLPSGKIFIINQGDLKYKYIKH